MERPKLNKERLKINKRVITYVLTIFIIFMAGFLGVLTGFNILIKPELEMAITTTTSTSSTSTVPVTTTTTTVTVTSTTTVATGPCNPCFEYFSYLGHNNEFLSIKNGPRSIKITRIYQTKGGAMTPDINTDFVDPNQLIIFKSDYQEGTKINIEYVDISSGNAYLDSATLH